LCQICRDRRLNLGSRRTVGKSFDNHRPFLSIEEFDMQVLCVLTLLVPLIPGQTTAPKPTAKPPAGAPAAAAKGAGRTVEITGGDDMKYNVTTINAKPGETLQVVLRSPG